MPTCRDVEPLITAVVDEQGSADDRTAVADHLRECASCRRRADRETAVRRMLRERVDIFRVTAPPSLRARCQPPPRATPWFHTVARPLGVWAAAGVVLVVFAAAFYLMSRGSTVFAAELAADHVKCFALFERASGPGDPAILRDRLKAEYGWAVTVPGSSPALGLQLVGARRCLSTDGRVAHILYRHAGRSLSLFVVPGTSRAAERLAIMGHAAMIWSRRGTTYVVLANEPRDQVERVAAYVKSVVN